MRYIIAPIYSDRYQGVRLFQAASFELVLNKDHAVGIRNERDDRWVGTSLPHVLEFEDLKSAKKAMVEMHKELADDGQPPASLTATPPFPIPVATAPERPKAPSSSRGGPVVQPVGVPDPTLSARQRRQDSRS